jgi:hypothetical protein
MATFSQHHVDGLDLALTPLQAMMRTFPDVKDEPLRCGLGVLSSSEDMCSTQLFGRSVMLRIDNCIAMLCHVSVRLPVVLDLSVWVHCPNPDAKLQSGRHSRCQLTH